MNNRYVLMSAVFLAMAVYAGAVGLAQSTAAPLSEAQWISPEIDDVTFLTKSPGECLAPPKRSGAAFEVELGRAAFNSPFLFGGTAARSGLSCNSCHRDGHDNPGFFLEGLSGAPGTADVTSSVFSKTREDYIFNPVRIPTLVDIAGKENFGKTAPQPSIDAFVASAVHDEFQGDVTPEIIAGIAAYVAHLNGGFCPEDETKQSVNRAIEDVARSLIAAEQALQRGTPGAADFLIQSARHGLGLIHERYRGEKLAAERDLVASLSRQLADLRLGDDGDRVALEGMIAPALARLDQVKRRLSRKERLSLYNEKQLRRFIEGEGTED